ncbi:AAA family ATPase [Solirubrobacter sp. CPCC 204708]|uniref:AAA family ATPase n=1 Tax=Solirubrobacter deserti TaxID=2282478 RepID=A0ABT4RMK4_9ACTN|nr:FtsH/Yme1/Tma family ATP-dependent metallopeptidase [Solirubrobacter deserti]MBE2314389.1 AAA family ATPase [Solirubrobacter deserti]MDA0139536.1 AAA family ATPase [Solirubrobacter deserti]
MPSKLRRNPVVLAVVLGFALLALVFGIASLTKGPATAPKPYTYSDLRRSVQEREVKTATLKPVLGKVEVELKDGKRHVVGYSPTDEGLAERLSSAGAQVSVSSRGSFPWSALVLIVALLLVVGLVLYLQRAQAKAAGAMNTHTKKAEQQGALPSVRFADVAGCDEAVFEAAELVEFLSRPEAYRRLGAKMPSGLMLYGPPGTGKTLLAKAVAGEAGAAFYAMSGSDFVEMYVGVGASRVRDLFAKARESSPAIIFIDEVDAIGAKRGGGADGGQSNREADQTLNQLLVEMDGFTGNERLLVIAATNRLDTLDPALLRPGRFSRHIHVSSPSEDGRLAILGVHAKGKPLAEDVDLPLLAKVTAGASGAELAEMLNEGAIMAARAERGSITHEDLFEGFLRVVAGPRKASAMLAAGERETVAYHEAGHVLCAELCPTVDKTLHATINPRGRAAGFAVIGRSDRALHTAQHIHEQLIYILGGRAAEHVINGTVSSGAANDLEKANSIARSAVEEYGLSAAVGQVVGVRSDASMATADSEVRRIVEDAYRDAIALVEEHREQLERLTQALLAAGDIDHLEIAAAMEGSTVAARRPNLAPLPDPVEPQLEEEPVATPRRRLWVPGPAAGAGAAIAAFRAERDRRTAGA